MGMGAIAWGYTARQNPEGDLFAFLAGYPQLAKVVAEYSGYNDEGYLEAVECFDAAGKPVTAPEARRKPKYPDEYVRPRLEELLYELLEARYGGWELNAGSYGTITVDVPAQKVRVDHHPGHPDYADEEDW
jgi:hypothetical protein